MVNVKKLDRFVSSKILCLYVSKTRSIFLEQKRIENIEMIWQRTIMHKLCHNTLSKGKGKTHNFK